MSGREIATASTGLISAEQQRAIAEVQARMIIARSQPRDPERSLALILQDCERLSLAEDGLYLFARGGSDISGPSINLMQVVATRYGNVASGIKILDRRDGVTECAAYAWDLENNVYDERQYRVAHTRRAGSRTYALTDERDLYEAEANAGQRRKRSALQAVIPRDIWHSAAERCEKTLIANADVSPEGIVKLLDAFKAFGVEREHIEARIQRRISAIRPIHIVQLKKIYVSLRDGMSGPEAWFKDARMPAQQTTQQQPATGNEALRERLAQKLSPTSQEAGPSQPRQTPAETGDRTPAGPAGVPATGDEPEGSQAAAAGELPLPGGIPVVKPQRAPRPRSGWDWPRFVDELIAIAETLPPEDLAAFRGANKSMIDSLQTSDKAEWSRLQQELAELEREGK